MHAVLEHGARFGLLLDVVVACFPAKDFLHFLEYVVSRYREGVGVRPVLLDEFLGRILAAGLDGQQTAAGRQ